MTKILIKQVSQETLEYHIRCILENFNDKFSIIFKGLPFRKSQIIMEEIFLKMNNPSDPFFGDFVAMLTENQKEKVVGALTLITQLSLKDSKKADDAIWDVLRRHLSIWKSFKSAFWLDAFSAKKVKSDELYIDSISVLGAYRGMGIGAKMIKISEEFARAEGLKKVTLYVSKKNEGAKRLYEKLGFQIQNKKKSWLIKRKFKIPLFYYMVKEL